jgi:hypothetical protein
MPRPPNAKMRATQQEETTEYFVYDKNATEIAGQQLKLNADGKPTQRTIRLTPSQAALAIANGSIGINDPADNQDAKEAVQRALGTAPRPRAEDQPQEAEERPVKPAKGK